MAVLSALFAVLISAAIIRHLRDVHPIVAGSASFTADYVRPDHVPFPEGNAGSPAREALGRALFFDARLSGSNLVACASCHNPGRSWGDGLPRAIGHDRKALGRRTPTTLNLAWAASLFWDGRAETLEEQALGPISAPGEMNMPLNLLVRKLQAIEGYRDLFARAYPGEGIAPATIAKALATFERTMVSAPAPFDQWVMGDEQAISEAAKSGFRVFNQEGRCATCHEGWRFTDDSFHDIGVVTDDVGRGAWLTQIPEMRSAFKTPTLRNIDRRAPYMHNGSVATLEETIELYDRGGLARRSSLSPEILPLGLNDGQKSDLVAFLRTLTSDAPVVARLTLPR